MALLSASFEYCPPLRGEVSRNEKIRILMNIKSSIKVALWFFMICKTLRTEETGEGGGGKRVL